jgi:hypothetical protein
MNHDQTELAECIESRAIADIRRTIELQILVLSLFVGFHLTQTSLLRFGFVI